MNVCLQWRNWSMDPLCSSSITCIVHYGMFFGHKCLALLPWQQKAASHTIRPLRVFSPFFSFIFFFFFECLHGDFFFLFNLLARCGIFEKFKISSNSKQKVCDVFETLIREKRYQILTVTPSLALQLSLKAPKWYGHKHFTGALLLLESLNAFKYISFNH